MDTDDLIERMFKAGAHYGYSKTADIKSLIHIHTKNKTDIIDPERRALFEHKFIKAWVLPISVFLLTKPEAKKSEKCAYPSCALCHERWIGARSNLRNKRE